MYVPMYAYIIIYVYNYDIHLVKKRTWSNCVDILLCKAIFSTCFFYHKLEPSTVRKIKCQREKKNKDKYKVKEVTGSEFIKIGYKQQIWFHFLTFQ